MGNITYQQRTGKDYTEFGSGYLSPRWKWPGPRSHPIPDFGSEHKSWRLALSLLFVCQFRRNGYYEFGSWKDNLGRLLPAQWLQDGERNTKEKTDNRVPTIGWGQDYMKEEIMMKDRDNCFEKFIQEFVQNSATLRLRHTSIKVSLQVHHFPSLQVETYIMLWFIKLCYKFHIFYIVPSGFINTWCWGTILVSLLEKLIMRCNILFTLNTLSTDSYFSTTARQQTFCTLSAENCFLYK